MKELYVVSVVLSLAAWQSATAGDGRPASRADKPAKAAPVTVSPSTENVILDTASLWRFRTVMETPELVLADGKTEHARITWGKDAYAWFKEDASRIELPPTQYTVEKVPVVRLPAHTPDDWMKADFDDSSWARLRGPMLSSSIHYGWKTILMRGAFEVADPARAGELKLSLAFRGGAVVYLNGEEITRSFMPAGQADVYTPAEPYPDGAYFTSDGYPGYRKDKVLQEQRLRKLAEFAVPAGKLRKGVNVLAVAIHRSPTTYKMATRRIKPYILPGYTRTEEVAWAQIGLMDVRLTAERGAAVVPNVALLKGRGFKLWGQSIVQAVFPADYPDPFAPAAPIRLTGVRNGTFAGQVVVADDNPIKGLKVELSDLKGPGLVPASALRVRYAALAEGRHTAGSFDSLEDQAPAEVQVLPESGGAVQPMWVTASVPADAKAGDYEGTLTISAEGVRPSVVPLKLHVADWSLPPVDKFATTLDIIQSPETLAMAYGVPLWSEQHFKLLDRTFSLLGPLGVKTLYVTCIRRTHFGNEHAMVRWVRGDDGELTPEFSIFEKYLDTAMRHIGPPRGVIFYCWEPPMSQGHAGEEEIGERAADKPVLITVVDPKTGALSARKGPAWGSPESKVFWKKLTDGVQPLLKRRGLENAMLFGLLGDHRATKLAMDEITNGVSGPKWAIHSHLYCDKWQGHQVAFVIALWGIRCEPRDPAYGYSFGWSNPLWLSYYPREMHLNSTLVTYRTKLEKWLGARQPYTPFIAKCIGPRGLGRIGGDFWDVLKDAQGRPRASLAGQYPEAAWGQLDLNFCIPYVLGKGRNGAVPTVRSEALREGLQEVEARVYLEKAWLDDEAKTLLGDDMMSRIRSALDDRIRMCLHAEGEGEPWFISSGWTERTESLFNLAAEISRKLGREPRPNLTVVPTKNVVP
jgi:hypothetical protein